MSDYDISCPLCGKDRFKGEVFCRDCQYIAENSFPIELLSKDYRNNIADKVEIEPLIENESEVVQEICDIQAIVSYNKSYANDLDQQNLPENDFTENGNQNSCNTELLDEKYQTNDVHTIEEEIVFVEEDYKDETIWLNNASDSVGIEEEATNAQNISTNNYNNEHVQDQTDHFDGEEVEKKSENNVEFIEETFEDRTIHLGEKDLYIEEAAEEDESFTKTNKRNLSFLGIGILLMLIISGVGSYFFLQNKEAKDTEVAHWNKCTKEDTPIGYSKYLVQYPNGEFSIQAQNKIIELRDKENKEWRQLRQSNDVNAFFAYLQKYQNTPYKREIHHKMDSLSWIKAVEENTPEAYKTYLDNVNSGNFAGEYENMAHEKYNYLTQLTPIEGYELIDVTNILKSIIRSFSSDKLAQLQDLLAPILVRFYKAKNISATSIVEYLKSDIQKEKIKNISYTITNTDSLKVMKDDKGIYLVAVPLKKEVVFIDKNKQKEVIQYTVNVELNENRQLQALYKK